MLQKMKIGALVVVAALISWGAASLAIDDADGRSESPAAAASGRTDGVKWKVSAFARRGTPCFSYSVRGGSGPGDGAACLGSSGYAEWLQPAYVALGDSANSMVVATFVEPEVATLRLGFGIGGGKIRWTRLSASAINDGESKAAGFDGPVRVAIGAVKGIDTGSPVACLKRAEAVSRSGSRLSRSLPMFCQR
jgi:hypothetical protein